jgi:predicted DNA-binding protein (MmcQ/YjbR family)
VGNRPGTKPTGGLAAADKRLRAHAMAKPHATEHFPWGERAIKVKGKVFVFMYADATAFSVTCKLPATSNMALLLPFAEPTGYGLGKAGWVSARFVPGDKPPVELLEQWIDESYLAVAPAKLAASVSGGAPAVRQTASRKPASKRPAPNKPASKKSRSKKSTPLTARRADPPAAARRDRRGARAP